LSSSNPYPQTLKIKNQIVGGEGNLPLDLLFVLEKPQPKNEKESHIIHFETLRVFFAKNEP
jgi:hypothetical protein